MFNPFKSIRNLWVETARELKKTAWPTFKELRTHTIVVMLGIALVGVFVALADFSLFQVVGLFTDMVAPRS